ncbi:MAG TPA: O-antigen ligase family protein, partial [Usitatibacter sp.]|nr:O-antigen ligase family protein [Usitatibacter sp.]
MVISRELAVTHRPAAAADGVLAFASMAFLFLTPFSSSAGWRGVLLGVAGLALAARLRESLALLAHRVPRAVAYSGLAWLAICAASVGWSVDRAYTLGELKPELFYPLLAFVVFFVAAAADRSLWPKWWIAILAGAAVAALGTVLQDRGLVPFARHEVDAGPGTYSTHLVLVLPLLFALDWNAPWGRGQSPRALLLALCALLAAAWYTGNRIVWVAFGAQLVVAVATWRTLPGTPRERLAMLQRLAVIAAIAFAVAFAASVAERYERNLLHDTGVPPGIEHDLRPKLWEAAWGRFQEAPWLGHGFGREVLASTFIPLTPPRVNHPQLRHAHNTFIDMALEVGALGLGAFLVLLAALALRYRAMLGDPRLAPLGIMGLALLAGFVVKNTTD